MGRIMYITGFEFAGKSGTLDNAISHFITNWYYLFLFVIIG